VENLRELSLFHLENIADLRKRRFGRIRVGAHPESGWVHVKGGYANTYFTTKKLHRTPAAMAEPMTPEELQAMACMSK
jgi:hypothetical protein